MDDLARVKRAADLANDFRGFRNTLQCEQDEKQDEEKTSLRIQAPKVALVHRATCATLQYREHSLDPIPCCTCGAARKYRQRRADHIEAHLDAGGTCSHRNALELRDHWYEAEAELTKALEIAAKLSARVNPKDPEA